VDDWMRALFHGVTVYTRRRADKKLPGEPLPQRESKQLHWDCGRFVKKTLAQVDQPQYGVIHKGTFLPFPDLQSEMGKLLVCHKCPMQLHCFEKGFDLNTRAPLDELQLEEDADVG